MNCRQCGIIVCSNATASTTTTAINTQGLDPSWAKYLRRCEKNKRALKGWDIHFMTSGNMDNFARKVNVVNMFNERWSMTIDDRDAPLQALHCVV